MSDKTLKFTNEYANSGTQKPHVFCLAMMFIIFYFCLTWLNTHMVNDSNFYLYKILTSRYQLKKKNYNTHFAKAFVGTLFTVLVCQL